MTILMVSNVPRKKAMLVTLVSWVASAFSYLALYSSGTEALMLGGLATIVGFTLYGFVSTRMLRLDRERAAKGSLA
ncbi:Putrescine-ornithine antiporter [compost metagenome]